MKIVNKPWGKEIWLELNDKYCYKRIHINAGTRTSYQYHRKKIETNYIIEGRAEIWLENDDGIVEKTIMSAGDFFTVNPPKKHRVIAITNVILQEVSTPEVDDVIRLEDDASRQDGRIGHEHAKLAVCILTAGTGRRMENLSNFVNKGLLPLDNKGIISHIIDKTPKEYEVVVALGYKGQMVKEYCLAAHPDRQFVFVEVDNFEGENSGPAYSINKCRKHLQRPFYFATSDTIITNDFPPLDNNWLGLYPTSIPELYSTAAKIGDDIVKFKNKDVNGYDYAFIGLAGIYDYKTFWEELDVSSGEIVSAFYNIEHYSSFKAKMFDWYDVGTIDNYAKAKKLFETSDVFSIPKINGEFLYKTENSFIKLFSDKNMSEGRIIRADHLKGLTPPLLYKGNNLYSYKWIPGKTLYDLDNPIIWKDFLNFSKDNLWTPPHDFDEDIKTLCYKFYKEKTKRRLSLFLQARNHTYGHKHTINNKLVNSIGVLLSQIDWASLCQGIPTSVYHGDLQFDNVIYGDDKKFYLIDWRQNFGGSTTIGDVYYDLSKMYGGILMSYGLMKNENNFIINQYQNDVTFSYNTLPTLLSFKDTYEKWLLDNHYDLDKIKMITALIYLNMAPLHEKKFGDILFFKSRLMMQNLYDK